MIFDLLIAFYLEYISPKMLRKTVFLAILCCSFERITSAPRSRRSAVVDFTRNGENFQGKIHVNGKPYELNLKRAESSVFTPDFRLTAAHGTPDGDIIYTDVTPVNHLAELENSIYEDEDVNAVFKLQHVDGEMRLHGIMDNIHISHDGQDHFAIVHDIPSMVDHNTDYLSTGVAWEHDSSVDLRQAVSANPELFITVDNQMWKDLGSDDNYTLGYLSVFIRGVNNRYKTVDDPSIKYKVSSATILKNAGAQPFIEESRTSNGLCDISAALDKFAKYMYDSTSGKTRFPKHDLAPLMSGEDFGQTVGLAWLGGACQDGWNNDGDRISWRTSVNRDSGGAWFGIHTMAHELAHNMGSPHDAATSDKNPKYDTTACKWSDGYIMSYVFNTTNRLTFSSCSKKYMKEFINSDKAGCVKSDQSSSTWSESKYNPGEYLSMTQQCQKREKRSDAKPYRKSTPDQLCSQLVCEWPTSSTGYSYRAQNDRALDGTACGTNGGKCTEGKCV